jgi:tRNA-splicing ligase RtcB
MVAVKTTLSSDVLTKEILQTIRVKIHEAIPVGMNHHQIPVEHPFLYEENVNDYGVLDDPVISKQYKKAEFQIGTLGGGNHFIEI